MAPATLYSQIRKGKPVHLIDVRSPAEYNEGHANGALIALFKWKVGIVKVIGLCAIVGLGYTLML